MLSPCLRDMIVAGSAYARDLQIPPLEFYIPGVILWCYLLFS